MTQVKNSNLPKPNGFSTALKILFNISQKALHFLPPPADDICSVLHNSANMRKRGLNCLGLTLTSDVHS